jgi:hypothetical protein
MLAPKSALLSFFCLLCSERTGYEMHYLAQIP